MDDAYPEKFNPNEVTDVLTEQETHPTRRDKQDHAPCRSTHQDVKSKTVYSRNYKAENEHGAGHRGCYSIIQW